MIKFLLLEDNIAYRVGVVDYLPENLDLELQNCKVDRFITKDVYLKKFKTHSHERE